MDLLSFRVAELLTEQRIRERHNGAAVRLPVARREDRSSVKSALATFLVRLGLRLDPAAGEGLGAIDFSLRGEEAR